MRQLEPGSWLRVSANGSRRDSGSFRPNISGIPDQRPSEREDRRRIVKLRDILTAAVSRQLVADVPVGIFLSGGMDSSILTALAARELGGEKTKTFSLGFPKAGAMYDETEHALQVARTLRTSHTVIQASEDDLITYVDQLVQHYDNPFGDQAALPSG